MREYFAYCMTINNPKFNDFEAIRIFTESDDCAFMVVGHEGYRPQNARERKLGKQPTPHLQIFVVCNRAKSFYEMKALFNRAHIEPARKFYEGFWYCFKENCFFVYGNILAGWEKWMIQKKAQRPFSNRRRENIEGGGVSVTPPCSSPDDAEPFSLYGTHLWEAERRDRKDEGPGYWND